MELVWKTLHMSVNEARKGPLYLERPFLYRKESSLAIARVQRPKIQITTGMEPMALADDMMIQVCIEGAKVMLTG